MCAKLMKLLMVIAASGIISACGGGGGGNSPGGSSGSTTPVTSTFTVSTSVDSGASIAPTSLSVESGKTATFAVTVKSGFNLVSASGCGGALVGSTYTTAAVTANCTVAVATTPIVAPKAYSIVETRLSQAAMYFDEVTTTSVQVTAIILKPQGLRIYFESQNPDENIKVELKDDGTVTDPNLPHVFKELVNFSKLPSGSYLNNNTVLAVNFQIRAYDASNKEVPHTGQVYSQIASLGFVDRAVPMPPTTSIVDGITASKNMIAVQIDHATLMSNIAAAEQAVTKKIYAHYPDVFDRIVMVYFGSTAEGLGPHSNVIKNSVTGINMSAYDASASYGSAGKLVNVANLENDLGAFSFLHEAMHTYAMYLNKPELNFAVGDTGCFCHFRLSTDMAGQVGYGSQLLDQGNGTYKENHVNVGWSANYYSDLELYLAGLMPDSEVKPFHVFFGDRPAQDAIIPASAVTTVSIADIQKVYGVRSPAAQTGQVLKTLFVAVSDRPLTAAEYAMVNIDALYYASMEPDTRVAQHDWWKAPPTFFQATRGRATLDISVPAAH